MVCFESGVTCNQSSSYCENQLQSDWSWTRLFIYLCFVRFACQPTGVFGWQATRLGRLNGSLKDGIGWRPVNQQDRQPNRLFVLFFNLRKMNRRFSKYIYNTSAHIFISNNSLLSSIFLCISSFSYSPSHLHLLVSNLCKFSSFIPTSKLI